jgi:chromosome segregation protein
MKLKKLELTGFKSFHERVSIHFPAGISAIVGPNGCGKSNILDALRWVMGEQSVKQLRGKSMEDIIFAGTNGKPPLNMAEVSLTVSNENGSGPEEFKDFTEIQLTRRMYRSGERTYLINRQPCRLKDIYNVFMGSGMGARSYAIIQQGNIGAITDAGPEERRLFLEEAAGITRYKTRRTEALRKVDATHRNLLRLADITTEIKRQMDSLKRQARKAEIYNKYQDRIGNLDIRIALFHHDDLSATISDSEHRLTALKDTDLGHSSELQKIDAAVEEIKLQRTRKGQEIAEFKAERFDIQRKIDRFENDLTHARREIDDLAEEIESLETARTELASKNRDIVSEVAVVKEAFTRMEADTGTVNGRIEAEKAAAASTGRQLAELNRQLERDKTALMDLVAQEARFKNIHQNATNSKESLSRRMKRIDEEAAAASGKITALERAESDCRAAHRELGDELSELNREVKENEGQLKEKNEALSAQVRRVQTIEMERNKARSRYAALKKMEENLEWYKDGVRTVCQAAESKDTPLAARLIGLVADQIDADPSFETAVEAVLGEALQYIIVADLTDGVAAVDFLQQAGNGRGGFIPAAGVGDAPPPRPLPSGSTVDRLVDHVRAKAGQEKILDLLLGQVLVVADLPAALAVHRQHPGRAAVVTKDGTVLTREGILIGGASGNLSGILAKKQEIKRLNKQIHQSDLDLEAARNRQTALEGEVRAIETDLQKCISLRNQTVQEEIEAEKALYRAAEDLKNGRRHLEVVRMEQEQLQDEAEDIEAEISKVDLALADIAGQVKAAQGRITGTGDTIATVSAEAEAFNRTIVDLKLQLTRLTASLDNSRLTLKRLEDFQRDGEIRLEQLTRDITRKAERRVEAKRKIATHQTSLGGMYEDLKALDKSLEENEAEYRLIDENLRENDRIISELQGKRETALQHIRLLEVELSQLRTKRENIATGLFDRQQRTIDQCRTETLQDNAESVDIEALEAELARCRKKVASITDVNLGAIREFEQLKDRYDFLFEQREDLIQAMEDLHKVIRKINRITQEQFIKTFDAVNQKMAEVFPRLFDGGTAKLVLTEPDKPLETGVEFMIHPPGKKLTRMSLLSGGEKALSAIAFIFSIFLLKPASFCLLDEIDAPLDDVNVHRFNELLKIIGENSQIIMITHNKKSMEFADTLFGITMENKGVSKVVSVNFEAAA